jgi:microcystin-dependent protein
MSTSVTHADPAAQYADRIAGYDARLQDLERSHTHPSDTPVGALVDWAGAAPPDMWLFANGAVLATAAYPELFAVLGYTYGGAGASFALPNCSSRVTVGMGTGPGLTARHLGDVGGAETVALTAAQLAQHGHDVSGFSSVQTTSHSHNIPPATTGVQTVDHAHTTAAVGTGTDSPDHAHDVQFSFSPVGAGGGPNSVLVGGSWNTAGANARHAHTVPATTSGVQSAAHAHTLGTQVTANQSADHQHQITLTAGATGTNTAHENMPPFIVLAKIIRAKPRPTPS